METGSQPSAIAHQLSSIKFDDTTMTTTWPPKSRGKQQRRVRWTAAGNEACSWPCPVPCRPSIHQRNAWAGKAVARAARPLPRL